MQSCALAEKAVRKTQCKGELKMKRILAMLLSVVMVCALFTGCGEGGSSETQANENNRPVVVDPGDFANTDIYPLEGKPQLSMGTSLQDPHESYLLQLMADAVGVDMSYRYLTDEQAPLLFVDMEQMPDILFSAAATFGLSLQRINAYGEAGALVNYMEHLDKMPNLSKAYLENPDLFNGVMSAEGEVYTLPYYVYTLTGCTNIAYFRGDHLTEVGWEKVPATVDELTQLLRDLDAHFGANDPKYIPMTVYEAGHAGHGSRLTTWLYPAFGTDTDPGLHIDDEGNVIVGFNQEQFRRMVKYLRSLVEEGLLDPDLFSAKSSMMQAFINENHTSVSTRMLNVPKSSYKDGVENYWISQPLTSEYTDTPVFAEPTIARKWGAMISSTCEDLDTALAYMDAFFATEENPLNEEGTIYNLSLWLGEEGVDWEWVEEGVSYKPYEKPDGWEAKHSYSGTPYIGKFHAMRINPDGTTDLLPEGVKENCLPYAKTVVREDALSLSESENEIYTEKWTDVTKYVSQMFAAFITGDSDIDTEWDSYVENLNNMGLQEVIECYEAAYARYVAWQEG